MIWHSHSIADVLAELQVDPLVGLSRQEAESRLQEYGENRLSESSALSLTQAFMQQLRSPLTALTIATAGITLVLHLYHHLLKNAPFLWQLPVLVGALTILSALFGGIRRYRTAAAATAARTRSAPDTRVLRDGVEQICSTYALVPGDILHLRVGDLVPADCRLIDAENLRCDEKHLTGAIHPTEKNAEATFEAIIPLAQRTNMLYFGTAIIGGTASAVVVTTGERSEMAHSRQHQQTPASAPAQKALGRIQLWWNVLIGLLTACALVIGLIHQTDRITVLLTAVTLLMAALPRSAEDLLTQLTLRSAAQIDGHNVHLYRPETAQTLGQITAVCIEPETLYQTEGIGLRCAFVGHRAVDLTNPTSKAPGLAQLLRLTALNANPADAADRAILEQLEALQIRRSDLLVDLPRIGELTPADGRKIGVHLAGEQTLIVVSGDWRTLLSLCAKGNVEEMAAAAADMEKDGLQVTAVAYRLTDTAPAVYTAEELERELIGVGLLGQQIPLRPFVKEAARRLPSLRNLLFSNASPQTAAATAGLAGLTDSPCVATLQEVTDATDEELASLVQTHNVYCGLDTQQKQRVLSALQQQGDVVAVTAAHSEQAPLLSAANVGFARGSVATDIAKQAADARLSDDSYTAVIASVWEGRQLKTQIRCAILYWGLCSLIITGFGIGCLFGWWPLQNQAVLIAGLHLLLMTILPIPLNNAKTSPRSRKG